MHTKSDSDATSYDLSSPRSPKRPVYYVQSPSRDSHDGDKSSSMHATPAYNNSPTESPLHNHSYGHHSRESSSSRVSGAYNGETPWGKKSSNRKRDDSKGWLDGKVIEEEGVYEYDGDSGGSLRRTQASLAVLGFVVVFTVFCLIIWGVSRPYKPQIVVKSLAVHNFYLGEGSDPTGVPTKMLTMNCSVRMIIYNSATFFGIHVSSKSVNLMYSEIAVATGELENSYQRRKTHKTVYVNLQGSKVPLYGAGASFAGLVEDGGVPMKLDFEVKSRGNVVGKLVRSKHRNHVTCLFSISPHSNKPLKPKENSCTYN